MIPPEVEQMLAEFTDEEYAAWCASFGGSYADDEPDTPAPMPAEPEECGWRSDGTSRYFCRLRSGHFGCHLETWTEAA